MDSDIQHFATMLSGCEAINSGDYKSPDSQYAFAVLKLHATDEGLVAGTEGFVDSVKRGAKKVGKWIFDMIIAFIGWVTNEKGRLAKIEAEYKVKREESAENEKAYKAFFSEMSGKMVDIAKEKIYPACDLAIERLEELSSKIENNHFYKDGGVPDKIISNINSIITDVRGLKGDAGRHETVGHEFYKRDLNKAIESINKDLSDLGTWLKYDFNKYRSEEDKYDGTLIKEIVMTCTSVYNSLLNAVRDTNVAISGLMSDNKARLDELKEKWPHG